MNSRLLKTNFIDQFESREEMCDATLVLWPSGMTVNGKCCISLRPHHEQFDSMHHKLPHHPWRQVTMTTCDNSGMTQPTTIIWKLDSRETWEQTCASNSDIGGNVSNSDSCFNLVDVLSSFPSCPWKTNLQIFLWYFNIHWIFWEQRHDFNPRKACLCII